MKDFTLKIYHKLLFTLKNAGYSFQTVENYSTSPVDKAVILRHDVDLRSWAALRLAKAENMLGIKSTYYFRIVKQSFNPEIIQQIASMGHEIGYHYEDLSSNNGNMDLAIKSFKKNLTKLRMFYPVKTICMHGSSGSPYDNRDLWKQYDFTEFGVDCEPYLSINYDIVLYLSDTGRRWNGFRMSLRDNVKSKYNFDFFSTNEVIQAVDSLPRQILFTTHPEQWTDNLPEWLYVRLFSLAHTFYKVHYRNRKVLKDARYSNRINEK